MLARYSDGGSAPIRVQIVGSRELDGVLPATNVKIDSRRIGIGENVLTMEGML
jgi:hypothetical protein